MDGGRAVILAWPFFALVSTEVVKQNDKETKNETNKGGIGERTPNLRVLFGASDWGEEKKI